MRMIKSQRGFSLLELLVATSIGLTVILMMTQLFKTGMDATMKVTQRAETQQNLRAAMQLMTKDISLAGAGLPNGGVQLSTGGGSISVSVPATAAFNLDAKTSGGNVSTELTVAVVGKLQRGRLEGPVNGGGKLVQLRSGGGGIQLNKL